MTIEVSVQSLLAIGLPTLVALGGSLWGVLWWAARHYFCLRSQFEAAQDSMQAQHHQHVERLASLEARMDKLPTNEQMEGLRGDIRALSAQLEGLATLQQHMSRQVELLNGFLLEHRA